MDVSILVVTCHHLQVRCPDSDCKRLLEGDEIQPLVEPALLERWERLTLQKTLDSMEDLVWCPKCEGPVIDEAADHVSRKSGQN